MCLLVGQGSVFGALPCTSNFLHPRHYTVPVSCRTLSVSQFQPWMSIPVAPVEHVQRQILQKNWHTESLSRAEHACHRQFPWFFVGHMPSCLRVLLCVRRPLCPPRESREPSYWVCSSAGVRIPSHAGGYHGRGGRWWGLHSHFHSCLSFLLTLGPLRIPPQFGPARRQGRCCSFDSTPLWIPKTRGLHSQFGSCPLRGIGNRTMA